MQRALGELFTPPAGPGSPAKLRLSPDFCGASPPIHPLPPLGFSSRSLLLPSDTTLRSYPARVYVYPPSCFLSVCTTRSIAFISRAARDSTSVIYCHAPVQRRIIPRASCVRKTSGSLGYLRWKTTRFGTADIFTGNTLTSFRSSALDEFTIDHREITSSTLEIHLFQSIL